MAAKILLNCFSCFELNFLHNLHTKEDFPLLSLLLFDVLFIFFTIG